MTYFPEGSGGGGPSGGTRVAVTSAISAAGGTSSITLDLPVVATPGSYTSVTVDAYGRVTAGGTAPSSGGTEVRITSRLSGAFATSLVTLDLPGVGTAGSYNSVTVDAYGRVTAGQMVAGSSSGTSFTPASALSFTVGSSNVTIDLTATGVTAGSSYNSLTVDSRGRVTAAQTVAGGSGAPTDVQYVVLAADATLTQERVLTVDSSLSLVDGGAGNALSLSVANGIGGGSSIRTLSSDTGRTANTPLDGVADLSAMLEANTLYWVKLFIAFRTQATTTGIRVRVQGTGSFNLFSGHWRIPVAADGTAGSYGGWDTDAVSSTESVVGTGVQATASSYLAIADYLMSTPASSSVISFAFASEVNASRVSVLAGSTMVITRLS